MRYPYYFLCDEFVEDERYFYFYDFSDHTLFKTNDLRADQHKEAANEEKNYGIKNLLLVLLISSAMFAMEFVIFYYFYFSVYAFGNSLYIFFPIVNVVVGVSLCTAFDAYYDRNRDIYSLYEDFLSWSY